MIRRGLLLALTSFLTFPAIQAGAQTKSESVMKVIYDVDLEQQESETDVGPGLAERDGSLWLAAKFDRTSPYDEALNSHLWKLDSSGKKIVDVELTYPATSGRVVKDEQSVVAGIESLGEELKVFVNYPQHFEFWVLYFSESGVLERSQKVVEGDVEIARVVPSADGSGEVAFGVEGTGSKVWRLDREEKVLWAAQLPLEESIVLDANIGSGAQVFLTTLDKTSDDKPATTIFVFDSKGKLRRKQVVDGFNLGLLVNGKDILSLRTTSDSKLGLVVLEQNTLAQKLSIPLPNTLALGSPLAIHNGRFMTLAMSNEPDSHLLIIAASLDNGLVQSWKLPVTANPIYFGVLIFNKSITAVGEDVGYVFLPGKSERSISRVLAFALPKD